MTSAAKFRSPSTIPSTDTAQSAPFENKDFLGEWFLIRTSNGFWKDKRNVRMEYTASGHDRFSYNAARSKAEKQMEGRNVPIEGAIAAFSWQGKGLLRLFSAVWEIVGRTESNDVEESWIVTFQHKTMFTAPAVNVACRSKNGLSSADLKKVSDWLLSLGDRNLERAAQDMYTIVQD